MAEASNNSQLQKRVERELIRRDAELSRQMVESSAGGGMVRVKVDGHRAVRSLVIDPAAFNGRDADLLADLIMSAIAEAQRRVDDLGEIPAPTTDLVDG